ncbi:MAG: tRNA preQ1(34) S-adenosylmethionine ribosyltransferase-isomerase QueA [Coriobacteriales bacterium]|jgi:S-adenosylmethionine:tRNA ribosyltransferase-isomerase|nr:tRNA preQ1(34) S-adenosylmethionine ribosyltransferase-isomerase QueA [Coriobacteriales bacterium]
MLTADFDYPLPQEHIAAAPAVPRDSCRLLVLHRATGGIEHRRFSDIADYLAAEDLLVVNETKVMPARLVGRRRGGGAAELLLLRRLGSAVTKGMAPATQKNRPSVLPEPSLLSPAATVAANAAAAADATDAERWLALVSPGRRLKPGAEIALDGLSVRVEDWATAEIRGGRVVRLSTTGAESVDAALHRLGSLPLPPYIHDYRGDSGLYQTVYAQSEGSAAAPTAGLHFTTELLQQLQSRGVRLATVDLEVGLDTFRPVVEPRAEDHAIHSEYYSLPPATVQAFAETRAAGGRVVAVGTTSVRSLESAWDNASAALRPVFREQTRLFIMPGFSFRATDLLLTNFHAPRTTLMMLVSAFAGRERLLAAYHQALQSDYRFLSFGDAMLIV